MISRPHTLILGTFLLLALLSSLPTAAAAPPTEQPGAFCTAPLPWENGATSSVDPLKPDQADVTFMACTSTSCPVGESCHCGICHTSCTSTQRYSCVCGCYDRCTGGLFFDESVCACAVP